MRTESYTILHPDGRNVTVCVTTLNHKRGGRLIIVGDPDLVPPTVLRHRDSLDAQSLRLLMTAQASDLGGELVSRAVGAWEEASPLRFVP